MEKPHKKGTGKKKKMWGSHITDIHKRNFKDSTKMWEDISSPKKVVEGLDKGVTKN